MSIVIAATAAATTAPAEPTGAQVLIASTIALAIGIGLAIPAGVFRRGSVDGPARLDPHGPRGGLIIVTLIGMGVWYLMQAVLAAQKMMSLPPEQRDDVMAHFTSAEFATLVTVPGIVGGLILLIGDATLRQRVITRLGIGFDGLRRGLIPGLIGTTIVIPFIYVCSLLFDFIYRAVGYEHPGAHELLLKLKDAPAGWPRWGLFAGAVLIAPLFEELLFRAHVQSLLLAFFQRLVRRPTAPVVDVSPAMLDAHVPAAGSTNAGAVATPTGGFGVLGIPETEPIIPYATPAPAIWPRWAAILVTAILFTAVHAAWTAPPIFLLAIALGYAYERTGSLWTTIIIHALFNGLSTFVFVQFMM